MKAIHKYWPRAARLIRDHRVLAYGWLLARKSPSPLIANILGIEVVPTAARSMCRFQMPSQISVTFRFNKSPTVKLASDK